MIISHRHRFIFLKTKKTASTSLEIALSKYCGPRDVITPIAPQDEAIRRQLGHPGPQNHIAPPWAYRPRDWAKLLRRRQRKYRFFHHMPARTIRATIAPNIWDGYFTFCFERSPWERVVSHYFWTYPEPPRPPIGTFIDTLAETKLKRGGYAIYTIDGEVAVDRVYRYEDLPTALRSIEQTIGLPGSLVLPRAKTRVRGDKRPAHEILNSAEWDRVGAMFAYEIERWGYAAQHPDANA